MAKVYLSLMQKGLRTIEEVPEKYRQDVQALLEQEGQCMENTDLREKVAHLEEREKSNTHRIDSLEEKVENMLQRVGTGRTF